MKTHLAGHQKPAAPSNFPGIWYFWGELGNTKDVVFLQYLIDVLLKFQTQHPYFRGLPSRQGCCQNYPAEVIRSVKSKMVAANPEVHISQVAEYIGTKLEIQMYYRGWGFQRCY